MWTDINRFGLPDPWRVFDRLDRLTPGVFAPPTSEFPGVNVWADGDTMIVTSELPGIDPKDVDISVVGKSVTLRGTRAAADSCEGDCYHRRERWNGSFSRSIELPFMIDQSRVEARFSKGVLQLTLPRAEADKPRKIAIKTE